MILQALNPRTLGRRLLELSRTDLGRFATASAVVQGFPLVSAPIVSRLYSPDAFGEYGVFYALAAILSAVALLSLNNAVLNERDDRTAFRTLLSLLLPCSAFCFALFIIIRVIPADILAAAFRDVERQTLSLLPLTVLFASLNTAGYTWALRRGRYAFLSKYKVLLGIATMSLQIGIGFLQAEAVGLVVANLLGYFLACCLLVGHIMLVDRDVVAAVSIMSFREVCSRNRGLVLHTTPASLINMLGNHLPELLINRFFGSHVLGQYSLGMRVIGMPVTFVSSTVQDVFRREATLEYAGSGRCDKSFRQIFGLMVGIAVFVILPIVLVLPWVFPFAFGSAWGDAGKMVQAVAVLILIRFVTSPLSYVWIITGRTGLDLLWQVGLVALTTGVFFGARLIDLDISATDLLQTYSLVVGLWYFVCLLFSYRWSRNP